MRRLGDVFLTAFTAAWTLWRAFTLLVFLGLLAASLVGWITQGGIWLTGVAASGVLLYWWFHPDD